MMKGKLKVILISLLLFPLFYSAGNLSRLSSEKDSHRSLLAEVLDKEEVTDIISIPKESAEGRIEKHWLGKDEIIVEGKLYDIISVTENGGELTLHCYFDAGEQQMNEKIKDVTEKTSSAPATLKPFLPFC